MKRILSIVVAVVLIVSTLPATVAAQTHDDGWCPPAVDNCDGPVTGEGPTTVDPRFWWMQSVLEREGPDSPVFGAEGLPETTSEEGTGATIRFTDVLDDRELEEFERLGVEFSYHDGEPVRVGAIYDARVAWEALDQLATDQRVERVEPTWNPTRSFHLEETSHDVGAAQVRAMPQLEADGQGVTVASMDNGFDVSHPQFFRADGGTYQWHDEGETGNFEPGEDTVEIDGERYPLRVLHAETVDRRGQPAEPGTGEGFRPDRDWLYADINDDGERNFGAGDGFTESDPAYGEPLFVVDDFNRNGRLDPDERLVRLETSKFKMVTGGNRTYRRGDDLIHAMDGQEQTNHGTGVTSIFAGGQAGYHERVGLAPGVDIIGYSFNDPEGAPVIPMLSQGQDNDATVAVHAWGDPGLQPFDGSSNVEMAMTEATDNDFLQVISAGNDNASGTSKFDTIESGETVEWDLHVMEGVEFGNRFYPNTTMYVSLFWQEGNQPEVTLVDPEGNEKSLELTYSEKEFNDNELATAFEQTPRGTNHLAVVMWMPEGDPLVDGTYTLRLEGWQYDDEMVGRSRDVYGVGMVRWTEPTPNYATVGAPATADGAIGVGAYAGRHAMEGSRPGELRQYSARGPRLGGDPAIDIAAPDDPYAAVSVLDEGFAGQLEPGSFMTFGGTSGAAPHVAATVALLAQIHPDWGADELAEQLLESADNEDLSPHYGEFPNRHWGFGKVDAFAALYGGERPPEISSFPRAELVVNIDSEEGELVFDASESSDPSDDDLQYRFDFEYDGDWDTDWLDEPMYVTSSDEFEFDKPYSARVDVRNTTGGSSGAVAVYEVEEPPPEIEVVEQEAGCVGAPGQAPVPLKAVAAMLVAVALWRWRGVVPAA